MQDEVRHSGLVNKSSSAESGVDVLEYHLSSSSSSEQGARYVIYSLFTVHVTGKSDKISKLFLICSDASYFWLLERNDSATYDII